MDTTTYEFSHGKKPRGFGHWCFEFEDKATGERLEEFFTGTFSEAKSDAERLASETGCRLLRVLP